MIPKLILSLSLKFKLLFSFEAGTLYLILFSFISTTLASTLEKPSLILGLGEQRLLRIPGLKRYTLGSHVIRILPLSLPRRDNTLPRTRLTAESESLLIKGVAPGLGDLWVWKQDGSSEHRSVRVQAKVAEDLNPPLERALGGLNEVEVFDTGRGVILRGTIQTLAESAKVRGLAENYPKEIHDQTESSAELLEEGKTHLQNWLKTSGLDGRLRVELIANILWIRGDLAQANDLLKIEKQVKTVFPAVQTEILTMPDQAPTVFFRVFLLELRRNRFQSLGLAWPGSAEGAFQVTKGGVQNLLQLDLKLQQLQGTGDAKILSQPELVVRAPGEAELFAGGELPIRLTNKFQSQVSWKTYGLTLRLKVSHTAGNKIRLDIFTEVSHLDFQNGLDQIPGIQANRMKTQVDATFNSPLLLSGLLKQWVRKDARGLPFLRDIPVLGLLFGSQDYLHERSELVAILYPYAAPPEPTARNLSQLLPKGHLPPPESWMNPREEKLLRESKDFPWNALQ